MMTAPAWWLLIVFCIDGAGCSSRLVEHPWDDQLDCVVAARALVQARVGYLPTFTCTTARPEHATPAPPFIAPEHWT